MANKNKIATLWWLKGAMHMVAIGWLCVMGLCVGCKEAKTTKPSEQTTAAKGDPKEAQVSTEPATVSSDEENDESKESNQKEIKKVKTLKVLKKSNGAETLVGKLKFESGKETQLTVEGDSPEAKQFKADWSEVVAKGKLPMEVREVKEVNGDMVTEINSVLVGPDDDRYYGAVWSYLEKKYKYLVDVDY